MQCTNTDEKRAKDGKEHKKRIQEQDSGSKQGWQSVISLTTIGLNWLKLTNFSRFEIQIVEIGSVSTSIDSD